MNGSNAAQNNENSVLGALTPQLQQMIQQWISGGAQATQGIIGSGGGSAMSPYAGQAAGVASQLQNFNALSPAQIAQLSSTAGQAVQSAGSTFASQSGGVANPALLEQSLAQQAGQATGRAATDLGSIAAQQKLSATEGAGSLFSGLNAQQQQALFQALGLQSGMASGASSGLGGIAGQYGIEQGQNNQASQGMWSGLGSLLGGLGSLAGSGGLSGLFGAGAGAAAGGGAGAGVGAGLGTLLGLLSNGQSTAGSINPFTSTPYSGNFTTQTPYTGSGPQQ